MGNALIPWLYLVWSDAYLSGKELKILADFVENHSDLIQPNDALKAFISTENSPSRETLEEWKNQISESLKKYPETSSLFELSKHLSGNGDSISSLETDFNQLEKDLGILSAEVISRFQNSTNSITSNQESEFQSEIRSINNWLRGSTANIENEVLKLLSQDEFAYINSADLTEYREKVLNWCQILAVENLGNQAFPEEYGGKNDLLSYFAIMETLSYHDLSLVIKFGVQFGLWGMSVYSLGTKKHHDKWLKDIGTMQLPGCFAMTETAHGSNVKGLQTRATYNHDRKSFTIHTPSVHDQKEYIGNAACHGQMATVFAKLIIDDVDYGVNAFVVPIRDKNGKVLSGITIEDCGRKMGLNGVDNGKISFDQVEIPMENMLDRFASISLDGKFQSAITSDNRRFFTMLGTLVGGRIGIPRSATSALKKGITIAVQYSDKRRQFGPDDQKEEPILNYRIHQRRLFPHLAKSYAFHFALRDLTQRFIDRTESEMQEIETLAAGMKSYITWAVRDGLQECREAMGGKGYLWENRIADLKNDTEIYTTFEGDNTVLMQLVAKNRLGVFRKEFSEMKLTDKIAYAFDQAVTAVAEKNPIITRNIEDSHLLDPEFHKNAFVYREKMILESVALRIQRLIQEKLSPYDAFNVVQQHLIDAANAYVECRILESFQKHLGYFNGEVPKEINLLYQLFALETIEKHKSWYLENGYFEAVKSKAIRKMVNQLCWDLRPYAVGLTDAFGIPEKLLGAEVLLVKN